MVLYCKAGISTVVWPARLHVIRPDTGCVAWKPAATEEAAKSHLQGFLGGAFLNLNMKLPDLTGPRFLRPPDQFRTTRALLAAILAVCGPMAVAQTNFHFTGSALLDAGTVRLSWVDNGNGLSSTDRIVSAPMGFWRVLAGPAATNRWYVAERCDQLGQPFWPARWAVGTWVGNCVTNEGTEGNDILQNTGTAVADCVIQRGRGGDDVMSINAASSTNAEVLIQEGGAGNDKLTAVGGSGGDFIWQDGGGGDDTLYAEGGAGNDWMFQSGGAGNHTITNKLSAGQDTVWVDGGTGTNGLVALNANQTYAFYDIEGNLLHRNTNGTAGTRLIVQNLNSILCLSGAVTNWQSDPVINEAWAATWGGNSANWNGEVGHACAVDRLGNVYVAGEFEGTVDFDPGPATNSVTANGAGAVNAFLSKFDANGTFKWVRTWGATAGRCSGNGVAVDATNGVYVAGLFQNSFKFFGLTSITSNAAGANNMMICKFDSEGNAQWVRTWGGTSGGESYSIAVDGTNVYAVGDYSDASAAQQVNFSPWASTAHWHTNHGMFDAWLMKLETDGHYIWSKTWGGSRYDDAPGVAVDKLGYVYAAGMYASLDIDFDPDGGGKTNNPADNPGSGAASLGITDVFACKFDPADGHLLWVRTWGGTNTDCGEQVIANGTNEIYVVGRFMSGNVDFNRTNADFQLGGPADLHTNYGDLDAFVCKYDAEGNYQWGRSWGGSGNDSTGGITLDSAGNAYVYGCFAGTVNFNPSGTDIRRSRGGQDISLSKFAPDGAYQWVRTFGGDGDDWPYGITTDKQSGQMYLSGSFSGNCNFDPGAGTDLGTGTKAGFLTKFMFWPR